MYICFAKRLNCFFARFNFTLSYHPDARNIKPGALSRQFMKEEELIEASETILPAPCIIASLTWDIEEKIQVAAAGLWSACSDNWLYVPDSLRSEVLEWRHSSRLNCHPGV